MNKKPANLVKSVDRTVDILEQLAKYEEGLGVTELGKKLDIHKSSVHRLLSTLVYRGLVKQDDKTGKYKLGLKIFELGSRIFNDLEVKKYARPYLEELVAKTGETAHLVIFDQGEVLYIDKEKSPQKITMDSQIGVRGAIHCTGVGKAIAAYLEEEKVEQIIAAKGLPKQTKNTITELKELKKNLEKIRKQGYAVDDVENEPGIRCVAAPIFNYNNQVIASVSVSGPTMRVTKDKVDELGELVRETGLLISKQLGYRAEDKNNF